MTRKKTVEFNAILNAFRMSLTVLFPIITFPYTSRIFLVDGSGSLNFASSYVQIFTLIASLGIYTYGVREGTRIRNDKRELSILIKELYVINVSSTIIAYVLLALTTIAIKSIHEYLVLIAINAISVAFTALGLDWIYGVYEDYTYITIRQVIIQLVTLIAMFVFVHEREDIYIWALIGVVPYVFANILNVFHARKYFDLRGLPKPKIKRHLRPIFILFATQVASKVYSLLDTILLGMMTDDTCVGLYSAAIKVNSVVILIFTAMTPVYIPEIIEQIEQKNIEQLHLQIRKVFQLILGLAFPCMFGVLVLRKSIILILAGEPFSKASITMLILTPLILIEACTSVFYYCVLVPVKKEKEVLICTCLASISNMVISIMLTPLLKQNGVAIGSVVGELVGLMAAIIFAEKDGFIIRDLLPNFKNYFINSIIMSAMCLGITYLVKGNLLSLIMAIVCGVGIYFGMLYWEKDSLIEMIKGIISKNKKERGRK